MAKLLKSIYILILIISAYSFSQANSSSFSALEEVYKFKIPDSLQNKSYRYLRKMFYEYIELSGKAKIYADSYISKGLEENDSLRIAKGYFLLSDLAADSLELVYLNRAIDFSRTSNDKYYPAILYYYKASFYDDHANYKNALDNYSIAYNIAKKNNPVLAYDSKFSIGALKNRIGKPKEALGIFKEYHDYILSNKNEYPEKDKDYLISLHSISYCNTKLQNLDTASVINKKGIKISLLNDHKDMYYYFVMNEGVNLFFKKEYTSSIDSLKRVIPNLIKIKDRSNEIFTRFYLGKSYFENEEREEAISEFKTIDSLYKNFNDLFPELRQGYKILINHYKNTDDKESQLLYLNRLIKVDSVLNSNYQYINSKIIKDFDTTSLILDKEELIEDLNQSNSYKSIGIFSLLILLVIVSLSLFLNYNKRKKDQFRFNQLIAENLEEKKEEIIKTKQNITNHLSDDIIEIIRLGLEKFESNKDYLNPNITVNTLAKNINSNSKYLSVFLNHYEQKKFTDYINDLRIKYAVEKLKTDTKFRKYTIKAIADTVGFSNPVSFSQAFYKKTGIKPSYFIKKINASGKK